MTTDTAFISIHDRKVQNPQGCGWAVAVPTHLFMHPESEWYPDSPSDVYTEVPCNEPADERGLCEFHRAAMDLPLDLYEEISEAHDGRAWS